MPSTQKVTALLLAFLVGVPLAGYLYLYFTFTRPMQIWTAEFETVCRADQPLQACLELIGPPNGDSYELGKQRVMCWKSGSGLAARPGKNNSSSDWGIVSKDGVIVSMYNLDTELGREQFKALHSEK